jgi:uncharacterized protein
MFELEPLLHVVRARSAFTGSHHHGERHWRTVGANGLWLAESLDGADRHVIFLFALLHDSMRENEYRDPQHGPRAAAFAGELQGSGLLGLSAEQFELLRHACAEHADGLVSSDPTVGACWDADRLDLPRVGVVPRPDLFSTDRARTVEYTAMAPPEWQQLHRDAHR